jgi:hypothetical protein
MLLLLKPLLTADICFVHNGLQLTAGRPKGWLKLPSYSGEADPAQASPAPPQNGPIGLSRGVGSAPAPFKSGKVRESDLIIYSFCFVFIMFWERSELNSVRKSGNCNND